jgi:hypothetical protein
LTVNPYQHAQSELRCTYYFTSNLDFLTTYCGINNTVLLALKRSLTRSELDYGCIHVVDASARKSYIETLEFHAIYLFLL